MCQGYIAAIVVVRVSMMARSPREPPAKFMQILEYIDGPHVILLERSTDFKIVAVAIERAGEQHPFFGAAISFDQWNRYRRGMVDLRFLFMFPRWRQWFFPVFSGIIKQAARAHTTSDLTYREGFG
jgi:hypothetical protein